MEKTKNTQLKKVSKVLVKNRDDDNLSIGDEFDDSDKNDDSVDEINVDLIDFNTASNVEKIKHYYVPNNDDDYIEDERRLKYNRKNRFLNIEFLQEFAYIFRKLFEFISKGTSSDIPLVFYTNGIHINFSSKDDNKKIKKGESNDVIIFDIEFRASSIFTYDYEVNSWNNGPDNGYDNPCHGILMMYKEFIAEVKNIGKKEGYQIFGQTNADGSQSIYGANYGSIPHQPREIKCSNYSPPVIEIIDNFEKGCTELSIPILEFKEACSQFLANKKKGGNGIFLITENALRFHSLEGYQIGNLYFRIGSMNPTTSKNYDPNGKDKIYFVQVTRATVEMLSEIHHCCKSFISFFTREDNFLRISFNITIASSKALIYIDNRNKN